ncbi:MAG: hypothetical protein WBG86_10705 [Polyangiales bacterium]
MPLPPREDRAKQDGASVYWVGHSLMNNVDARVEGAQNVMELVGRFADARGEEYAHYDHTLWGSALHFNWRGKGHGDDRDDAKPRADRAYLRDHGNEYDNFVFTEVVPIEGALDWAYSIYYLRKFYCEALRRRPDATMFLYEVWRHAQPDDPEALDFETQVLRDRRYWDELADNALGPRVDDPGRAGRWLGRLGIRENHCNPTQPIYLIPAATGLSALSRELSALGSDAPVSSWGMPTVIGDAFANAYIDWPPSRQADFEGLTARDPSAEHDSIHLSAMGSYFVALVAYATVYASDPSGLPALNGVSEGLAPLLQRVAWKTVTSDERSGVRPVF